MTIAEFALALGKTERQVYRYINQGRLEVVSPEVTGLAGIRIPKQELERFVSRTKPSVQQVVTFDFQALDVKQALVQQVPLERHEAALLRLGALEKELEMTRKMLTDGGSQVSDLQEKLRSLELEQARSETKLESEMKSRREAEQKSDSLADQLAQAENRLKKRWWKFW